MNSERQRDFYRRENQTESDLRRLDQSRRIINKTGEMLSWLIVISVVAMSLYFVVIDSQK